MKSLDVISTPEKEVSLHKKALKYALLNEYRQEATERKPFWKGGEYIVKHKLITIGFSGFLVVALLFGYAFIGNNFFTPRAEAQEMVDKAFDTFIKLSPEEKEHIEKKIKADMEVSLEEAKNAKDLEIVPEDEIQRFTPPKEGERGMVGVAVGMHEEDDVFLKRTPEGEAGVVTHFEKKVAGPGEITSGEPRDVKPGVHMAFEPGKIPAPEGMKVLRYTDPNGNKVILGINEKDEPVMKTIRIEKSETGKGAMENIKFFHAK